MTTRLSFRPLPALATFGVLAAGLFWLLRAECYSAEAVDTLCSASAMSFISLLGKLGKEISSHSSVYFTVCVGIAMIAVLTLLRRRRAHGKLSRWSFLYLSAILLALCGELAALHELPALTFGFYAASLCSGSASLWLLARQSPRLLTRGWIDPTRHQTALKLPEALSLMAILILIGITRFYALNRLPYSLDDEACVHRAIATSWTYIAEQEAGSHVQQSSGMSWMVLHKWFTRLDHPTLFYLDERILGAGISFTAFLIIYFGFRYLCGPFVGFLATITYAFGPLDIGWSRLPVLHHFPVAIGLLLAIASFSAFSSRSWKSFLAVSVLITLTKFLYPSAKLLALGPALGMLSILLWHRVTWKGHKRKLSLLVLGGVLFFAARPLIKWFAHGELLWVGPFPLLLSAGTGESPLEIIKLYAWQTLGFFYELLYGPFNLRHVHWTLHATIEPHRAIASLCSVFVMLALARLVVLIRNPSAATAIGLIVAGLIPGIASEVAERRIAFSIILASFLALIELSWFIDIFIEWKTERQERLCKAWGAASLAVILLVFQAHSFFSRPAGKNIQLIATEEIRPLLRDGTLVVQPGPDLLCGTFYGINDILKAREGRIGYTNPAVAAQTEAESVTNPQINPHAWFYRFTDLRSQTPTLMSTPSWSRYLFFTHYTVDQEPIIELLKKTYPDGRLSIIQTPEPTQLQFLVFDSAPEPNS